jgi:predicted dehydrogenase
MNTYTLSVVGVGMGGTGSVHAAAASERFELTAIADLREEARAAVKQQFPDVQTFATHGEMFAQCPTEVVCIATYAPTHKPIALAALKLPLKGILVEKPLAEVHAEGTVIVDSIKAKNLPLAVPHGLLVSAHVREILQRVRGGEIGELSLVEIECDKWDLINAGIHWLNFFVTLVGDDPVADVLCACDTSTRTYRDGMQVETVGITYVQTQGGVRCVMQTGDHVTTKREGKSMMFRLLGTKGHLEFWAFENAYILVNEKHPAGKLIQPQQNPTVGHRAHLENMAAQMDAHAPDYTIADSSLRALEVVEAAYLSHRHRCLVTLPLQSFEPPAVDHWDPGRPYLGSGGGRDGRKL